MNIVVPYVNLHPVTQMILSDYQVRFVKLHDEDGYRRLMQGLWAAGNDVLIVEHDIAPWPGALEELWTCMGLWCSVPYKLFGGYGVAHSLGCCRIRVALMAKLPGLWDEPCKWDVLDQRLFFAARDIGTEPHVHRPSCVHMNPREYPHYQGPQDPQSFTMQRLK